MELTAFDGRKFNKPTFENFLTHQQLVRLCQEAMTVCCWDFNTSLGNTIREKYQSLHIKVNELTATLMKKGAAGYFWIVTSPEISSIIETATYSFMSISPSDEELAMIIQGHFPMGIKGIQLKGLLHSKWRIYVDAEWDLESILVGCNDTIQPLEHYGRLAIANFVV